MRIGIFGGTFDPIHLGHLVLAELCRDDCKLDRVLFVVAGEPPHKRRELTDVSHRLEMVRIATAGHPDFTVSDVESTRPGPHYSVQTLGILREQYPEDEFFFLIGADSLTDLPNWREPARITQLATLVVVNRQGHQPFPETSTFLGPNSKPVLTVAIPTIGISSSDLRARMKGGQSIRYQVTRGVEAYIQQHALYSY